MSLRRRRAIIGGHRRVSDDDGRDLIGDTAGVFATDEAVVAALPPPDGPRVLDEPVLDTVLNTVANYQHSVVDFQRFAVLF